MRFPEERIASFVCSFGGADHDSYTVVDTEGALRTAPAYEFRSLHRLQVAIDGETDEETFPICDRIAPEIMHFSDCVLNDRSPEPSGWEGLADIRVVEAVQESARTGRPIGLEPFSREHRPDEGRVRRIPPVEKQDLVRTKGPS